MTIHINELIELLAELFDNKKIKATATQCAKGGVLTGVCAAFGGLLLGPVGLAVGGALGGLGSALVINDFQPAAKIIREMSLVEKEKLAGHLAKTFRDFGVEDIVALSMLVASNSSFQETIIRMVENYLTNEMKMKITS